MLNLAETIKNLRIKNGYTQEQLAEACGISRQAVAKWEAGANLPDIEKIVQLAILFHTTVDELLSGNQGIFKKQNSDIGTDSYAQNEKIVNQALQKAMKEADPDKEIAQFISFIGSRIGCTRIFVLERNTDGSYQNTYEWCDRENKSQIEYLQNIPLEDMTFWLKLFSNGEYIFIENVDDMATSQPEVYKWLKPQGVNSILVCPLFGGKCFLGADNPTPAFSSQTASLLEIVARFVESMLQRRDLESELKIAAYQNDQFSRFNGGIRYRINVVTDQLKFDQNMEKELGYTFKAETLTQLDAELAIHPEFHDHLMIDGFQRAVESKENLSIEFISYRDDRTIRWNRISISPYMDGNGNVQYLCGFLQDISGRHMIVEKYNQYISHLSGGLHICYLSRPIHLEYASDDLCAFLGYSRDEFEAVTKNKYSNVIAEEDRAVFLGYAKRLAQNPGIETCEYRLIKKDGSTVKVVDTMESIMDSNGIMYGYAYIMEESQTQIMLDMAKETEQHHLSLINRQYKILEILGEDYLNVFYVWLDEDKAQIVKLNGYITKGMDRESAEYIPYYRFCQQYIQDRVYAEDQPKMLKAMRSDTVRRAFCDNKDYIVVYRISDKGNIHYYQLRYVRIDSENGETNFIAGFKNIDRIIGEEINKNKELQNRLNIINAILQAFACGYYYKYSDDTFIELANKDESFSRLIGQNGNFTENRKRMSAIFPDKDAFKSIDDFIDPSTLSERLSNRKFISEKVKIGKKGCYEIYIFVVDYDDKGQISSYIVAARDISREINREEKFAKSLKILSKRERTALQYAYTDVLTGVMNRNAFERDVKKIVECDNVGIVFCDVNNLKKINDNHGHNEGDLLLQKCARILKKFFSVDYVYRVGGDEFICMIGNLGEEQFMTRVAALKHDVMDNGDIIAIGAAYGNADQKDMVISKAEAEMYSAKNVRRD